MHRMQMVCGWKKKSTERQQGLQNSVCICVCEICLKWPCVSSSLTGSRSCVESRPVSSLCSCCSVMLLALNTQTHSSMLTAGTSPLDIHAHLEDMMFVFVSKFGFKDGSSGKKMFVVQTSGLCLQNQHSDDATFKVWFCWFTLNIRTQQK